MKNVSQPLITCGVKRTTSMVVEYLADHKQHGMHEIERATDLRQPEVSMAVTELMPFLTVTNKSGERGRPQKIVCLPKLGLENYIKKIVKSKQSAIEMLNEIV